MKHFVRLTALLLVVASIFTLPGYAVAEDNPYINGMSIGSIEDTLDYYRAFSAEDKVDGYYTFNYALYHTMSIEYVDIVMKITGNIPTALSVNGYSLTRVSLGNSLYRYFGSVNSNPGNLLPFKFTSSGAFQVSILNFNMAVEKSDHFHSAGVLLVDGKQKETWTSSGSPSGVSYAGDTVSGVESSGDFQVKITDWKGADYAELLFSTKYLSIGSISAYMDSTIIPIQVEPIYTSEEIVSFHEGDVFGENGGSSYGEGHIADGDLIGSPYDEFWGNSSWTEYYEEDSSGYTNSAPSSRVFRVRLDLRGVDRTSNAVPLVRINAKYSGYYGFTFKCGEILCFVDLDGIDDSWLSSIEGFFAELKANLVFHLATLREYTLNGMDNIRDTIAGNPSNVENESSTVESQGDVISGYEEEYQTQLEEGSGVIRDTMNFGNFATALSFVSGFVGSVAISLGDYLVVFTLPLVLGFILFLCSRVPYNTRPRKSPGPDKVANAQSARKSNVVPFSKTG